MMIHNIFKISVHLFLLCITGQSKRVFNVQELLRWEPPQQFVEDYPYFLTGYDADDLPVWILSIGRWDMKAITESNPYTIQQFDKYVHQMFHKIYESPKNTSTNQFIIVEDLEGYSNLQLVHRRTVRRQIELFQEFAQMEKTQPTQLKKGFGVNLNFPARTIWQIVRGTLGDLSNKIEIFGSQKWKAVLHKEIPSRLLPEWLGGSMTTETAVPIWGKRKFRITKYKNILEKE